MNVKRRLPIRFDINNAIRPIIPFFAVLLAGANATAIDMPLSLNLTPYDSTYNSPSIAISLTPLGLGTATDTETSYLTGTCPMSLDVVFDPSSHQATIQGLQATQTNPGMAYLSDTNFQVSWNLGFLGTINEYASMSNAAFSVYTPAPPTPVIGGQFAANQQRFQINQGTLTSSGAYYSSLDLSSQPIDGPNAAATGSIAMGNPTMNGTVATYPVSFQMPISVYQSFADPDYAAALAITGMLQATGQLQFDFGPRPIFWNSN